MRFPGRRQPPENPHSVEAMREYAARRTPRSEARREIDEGQLEGLGAEVTSRARLLAAEGESAMHHAGYLLGRFLAWVESTGRALDEDLTLIASTYFAELSVSGGKDRWDPADPRLRAHTYGMVAAERERGGPVPVATESLLVSWLTAHAGLRPGDDAGRLLAERRARRHARLFPDVRPEEPGTSP